MKSVKTLSFESKMCSNLDGYHKPICLGGVSSKDSAVEGEILSGYCTCTADLCESSCNHVARLLFRVEAAF